MKIGGMLGGASAEQSNLLYDFGRILGIAFQIQDDVLDVFGNPNKVGKIAGGDIRQNKKTYLYVAALEKLSGRRKEELMYLFDTDALQDESKVTRVIDLYNAAGVRQRAEKYQQKLYESALDKLNQLQEDRLITGPLEELASTLYKRHK
jgi:geranylgeranyl diphosphate synthase type II